MTIEEIKIAMREQGLTVRALANALAIHEAGLSNILNGHRKLTETLSRHIEYVLGKREAIVFYRVNLSEKKVEEITSYPDCSTAERETAMQAIIAHNLEELIKIGSKLDC